MLRIEGRQGRGKRVKSLTEARRIAGRSHDEETVGSRQVTDRLFL